MSQLPAIETPAVITEEALDAAIGQLRKLFPDNADLGTVSDEEIKDGVRKFLEHPTFPTDALAVPEEEGSAKALVALSPCEEATAIAVVDVVFAVLTFVGFPVVALSGKVRTIAKVIEWTITQDFESWQVLTQNVSQGGTVWDQAQAVWAIVVKAFDSGLVGQILSTLAASMSWWDWTLFGVSTLAMVAALVLSGGSAFVLWLLSGLQIAYLVTDCTTAVQACKS